MCVCVLRRVFVTALIYQYHSLCPSSNNSITRLLCTDLQCLSVHYESIRMIHNLRYSFTPESSRADQFRLLLPLASLSAEASDKDAWRCQSATQACKRNSNSESTANSALVMHRRSIKRHPLKVTIAMGWVVVLFDTANSLLHSIVLPLSFYSSVRLILLH